MKFGKGIPLRIITIANDAQREAHLWLAQLLEIVKDFSTKCFRNMNSAQFSKITSPMPVERERAATHHPWQMTFTCFHLLFAQ